MLRRRQGESGQHGKLPSILLPTTASSLSTKVMLSPSYLSCSFHYDSSGKAYIRGWCLTCTTAKRGGAINATTT